MQILQRIRLSERGERITFAILLLILLWPVWANKYFLTLDGPCHLYNSYVLLQFWKGIDVDFFSKYYQLNQHPEPNWFSHLVLASLMSFTSPLLAEKILLSVYVIGFAVFSRMLVRLINKDYSFLSLLPLLFVYTHVLQMGFYNFSFSLLWMILMWWFFFKYDGRLSLFVLIPVGGTVIMITYLSHPVGYLIGVCTLGLAHLLQIFEDGHPLKEGLRTAFKRELVLFTALLPSLVLLAYFFIRRNAYGVQPGKNTFSDLFWGITHFTGIIDLTYREADFAITVFYVMLVLLATALVRKFLKFRITRYDAFLAAFIALMIFFFDCPGAIGGAGILPERIQVIPFAILPFWLASATLPQWMKPAVTWVAVFLLVALMWIRIPVHAKCSDAVEEYMSAAQFIPARSTVLPLSYADGGKDVNGKEIANATWIFFHAGDYLGTEKSLVMLGNYEANTGYFPLLWRDTVNPFKYIGGLEQMPPCLDINNYIRNTGVKIDYLMTLCLDTQYINHPCTVLLMKTLDSAYTKIYTSAHGRAVLYRRNGDSEAHEGQ